METVCKICGRPLLDDQNIAHDNFGVNLEVHADCLTLASDGRAEGLREAAALIQERRDGRYKFAAEWVTLDEAAAAILARAAELEKADE